MTDLERFFYVLGVGSASISAVVMLWSALCFGFDRLAARRARRAAVEALIRGARVSSHWIVPAGPRGRG